MERNKMSAEALLKNLQEREKEQSLILSISDNLAPINDIKELSNTVTTKLKALLAFDDFIICTIDEKEMHYSVFYQYLNNAGSINPIYNVADGIFDRAIAAADNTIFELSQLSKKQLPDYILKAQGAGIRYLIGVPLPYQKKMPAVVFLLYKRPNLLDRQGARLLKGIGTQLSITLLNIANAQKWERLNAEMTLLRQRPDEKVAESVKIEITEDNFHGIIGKSEIMQHVFDLIEQVAYTDTNVLIMGETGTGKEVVAQAIHRTSAVKNRSMVRVNCAAIPANLIESELFGHEKGSFTGATEKRLGKFELANNSTIFLDEIGELPLELQAKMLRVIQEREIERIGASGSIKVNVRVIAATNRDLLTEVAEGRFRSDLYYRLNVYPITIPALRDRMEDLPLLSTHFLKLHAEKTGKKVVNLSKRAKESMTAYQWPGNVRELSNIIERSILYTNGDTIRELQFPHTEAVTSISNQDKYSTKTLQQVEKEHILSVIKQCSGRISGPNGAAVLLGVPSTTLISKMQKLGIKKGHTV